MAILDQSTKAPKKPEITDISYILYDKTEDHLQYIQELMAKSLSERYNIYVYRHFLDMWPNLCFLAQDYVKQRFVGAVIGKIDEKDDIRSGYIAMVAVEEEYQQIGIGRGLIKQLIANAKLMGAKEVCLETEVDNKGALHLYHSLGFVRDRRYARYYLNGKDAFSLRLFFESGRRRHSFNCSALPWGQAVQYDEFQINTNRDDYFV